MMPPNFYKEEVGRLRLEIAQLEKNCGRLHQSIGDARELLDDVLLGSVDARTYPDGPNLDRELRTRIKAYLSSPNQ